MKKRVRKMFMLTGIMCVLCFSVCACRDNKNASAGEQAEGGNDQDYSDEEMKKFPSKAELEEIERANKKMREEGILDENGQPMPGVDSNDYPGLG